MAENESQILIKGIFSRIKEKYGYTDEQTLIYLQGYQDCAEENQETLEKRDKMLKDTVAELCEAKRLLKAAVEDFSYCSGSYGLCYYNIGCGVCAERNNIPCDDFQWRYADEVQKLLKNVEE